MERGQLIRLRQDDLELQWETDDAFYRAERRLEDIEALMKDGGKSAVQLVIEVFLSRPNEGLTADDVWGLVAISRLFAKSTISQVLSQQSGLFEHRERAVVHDGRRDAHEGENSGSSQRKSPDAQTTSRNDVSEVVRLARRLNRLLESADDSTIRSIAQLLDFHAILERRGIYVERVLELHTLGALPAVEVDPGEERFT